MNQPNLVSIRALMVEGSQGAIWGTETEDLDATLVRWNGGTGIAPHTNDEVDVVMIVLAGGGTVQVDGGTRDVGLGTIVVIPKGTERSIQAAGDGLTYLNVHKRKRKMMPDMVRPTGAREASA